MRFLNRKPEEKPVENQKEETVARKELLETDEEFEEAIQPKTAPVSKQLPAQPEAQIEELEFKVLNAKANLYDWLARREQIIGQVEQCDAAIAKWQEELAKLSK